MNHLRLRTCDWTQRPKPLRRTKREISRTSDLYRRALVQRKHAHEFNCTGTAKTTDIEVSEQRVSSYVTRRPSRNMSQLLINTGKGIERKQIESKGQRHSPRQNPQWGLFFGTGRKARALHPKDSARKEVCYGHATGRTWIVESLLLRACYRHLMQGIRSVQS